MAKNKLKKFRENDTFWNLIQPTREEVEAGIPLKGKWHSDFFKNENPIIVELGCGKGDYTIGLAKRDPSKNYIGIDLKGARLHTGAKEGVESEMKNVGFVRTQIELLEGVFAENEIDEIWITFPDPQIKFKRMKHRMTNPEFLKMYQRVLKPGGIVHLKCDSEFLHGYTHGIVQMEGYEVLEAYHDIYHQFKTRDNILFEIKTYYEQMWLKQGKAITYIKFRL